MTCPSNLTRSRYADGALPAEEVITMERHLSGCAECRMVVDSLAAESHALRVAMQAAESTGVIPAFVTRPTLPRLLSWFACLGLAAWAVNAAWVSLTSATSLPTWLGWLAPDVSATGTDLAVGLVVLLVSDGADLLSGFMEAVSVIAVIGTISIGFWLLARRRIGRGGALCLQLSAVMFLVSAALPGHAFEIRRDENRVLIPASETIDDTLIVVSDDVLIEGTVTGDVIAFGEEVRVTGQIGGMLVTGAETISIEGEVKGSVLAAAETVDIRGAVLGGNLYSAGKTVTMYADVRVAGNAALAGAEVEVQGAIGRDLLAAAEKISLLGNVAGNLRAYAEQVNVETTAGIGGDLTAKVKSPDHLMVADGATVEGETHLSTWPEEPNRYTTFQFYLGQTLQLLAAFVTGLVIFYLFPALGRTRLDTGGEVLTTLGIGVLALIATPVIALIVTVTLIGAPIGVLGFILWLACLYLAGILTAGLVGRLILDADDHGKVLPLLVGLVILFVLTNVPLLGGLIQFLAILVGLGLIGQWLREVWADRLQEV